METAENRIKAASKSGEPGQERRTDIARIGWDVSAGLTTIDPRRLSSGGAAREIREVSHAQTFGNFPQALPSCREEPAKERPLA